MADFENSLARLRGKKKFSVYKKLLENGEISMKQIIDRDLAHFILNEFHYISLISRIKKKLSHPPKFFAWFSGTTGTGKTRTSELIAATLGFEIYDINYHDGIFSPYAFEECAIVENYDYEDSLKILKILKKNKPCINTRGGKVFFCPKIVIFTGLYKIKEKSKNKINYIVDFEFLPENKPGIPTEEEVLKAVKIACYSFLKCYKNFLYTRGYQELADSLECLKSVPSVCDDEIVYCLT